MPDRTQANHEEMNFHFSRPHIVLSVLLLDEIDPMNMMSYSSDESLNSNYKLFKNQNGEVFPRYVGTNCRNDSPMKKIWVPKRCLENLQVNVIMTPPVKNRNPRSNSSYGSKSSYEHHHANPFVSQGRSKDY